MHGVVDACGPFAPRGAHVLSDGCPADCAVPGAGRRSTTDGQGVRMTDTGQVPGEGLPENAGMVEQPGVPAPGAYTFLDPADSSANTADDDDLLLMPGAQGAWSDPQSAPRPGAAPCRPPPPNRARTRPAAVTRAPSTSVAYGSRRRHPPRRPRRPPAARSTSARRCRTPRPVSYAPSPTGVPPPARP